MKKFSVWFGFWFLSLMPLVHAFESLEGGFSINMPGAPTTEVIPHKSIVGTVREHTFSYKIPTGEFTASYTQLPKLAVILKSRASLLKSAEKGFLKDTGATTLSQKPVFLKNLQGSELFFELPRAPVPLQGKVRFFLAGEILYVVMATANPRPSGEAAVNRFINSFALLK